MNNKCAPKPLFLIEKQIQKNLDDSRGRKFTFESHILELFDALSFIVFTKYNVFLTFHACF